MPTASDKSDRRPAVVLTPVKAISTRSIIPRSLRVPIARPEVKCTDVQEPIQRLTSGRWPGKMLRRQ